ncbi:MAG TPA: transglutaminase domain-containing protein [Firmicutes bacterium]|nr:transglutaminase domain-containing protein [Bacillota bacterium]
MKLSAMRITAIIVASMLVSGAVYAKIDHPVFPGYFKDVDRSDPNAFLQTGDQTKITPAIRHVANGFNSKKDVSTLQEIFQWMRSNLRGGEGEKFARTADEIISSRIATGCTDYGLAFASLARAKRIPTVFVQSAKIDWIELLVHGAEGAHHAIHGHIYVEVYIDGKPYLVDSTTGKMFLGYNPNNLSLPDGYYAFAKSIEVWDSGVANESENSEAMQRLFRRFDLLLYQDPQYDYIDLRSGATRRAEKYVSEIERTQLIIAGLRKSVEYFADRFASDPSRTRMCSMNNLTDRHIETAQTIVVLYTPDQAGTAPKGLTEVVPELRSSKRSMLVKEQRDGKNIIFIKEQTEAELIDTIKKLPGNFMLTSFIPMVEPKSEPALDTRMSPELLDMLRGLTTEELEELLVYINELISHR